MEGLTRRQLMAGTIGSAAAVSLRIPYVQAQKRGGTLRVIPHADLKAIDPIWTAAYISRNFGYMVYDTLFATDANLQIRPQMVDKYSVSRDYTKYSFTLRDGLRFHDGQPVTAEDCVLSLQRWGKKDALGRLLLARTAKLQASDRKTFVLELSEPFDLVIDALGKPSSTVPFIMPARLAATSENEQVKEANGSGPYRFFAQEWQPGNQVVFERNPQYVPRNEPASGAAGGKHVYLDRVIWRWMPDQATASIALEAGEVDYLEQPIHDLIARLERNANLTVFVGNPRGNQGWLRPNHLHPPFNNKKARQALLWMMDQERVLQAVVGQPKYYRSCPAYFVCGAPYETGIGAPGKPDFDRARQLLREAGYDGRPIVILDPTDYPALHSAVLVIRELLTQGGLNVQLAAMDWGGVISSRTKKETVKEGGWDIHVTWWMSSDVMTPALNAGFWGGCDKGWFGWYCSEQMEKLRGEWARTADGSKRKQVTDAIQNLAYDEVPYVMWGQFVQPAVYRKSVRGALNFACPIYWNISLET